MTLNEAMTSLAHECEVAFRQAGFDIGLDDRSNYVHNIRSNWHGDLIEVLVPGYIKYIQSGRRQGSYVPIAALVSWAYRMQIPTSNKVIYAIQQSIYNNGIPARDIEG
jgi:hypothetical protein